MKGSETPDKANIFTLDDFASALDGDDRKAELMQGLQSGRAIMLEYFPNGFDIPRTTTSMTVPELSPEIDDRQTAAASEFRNVMFCIVIELDAEHNAIRADLINQLTNEVEDSVEAVDLVKDLLWKLQMSVEMSGGGSLEEIKRNALIGNRNRVIDMVCLAPERIVVDSVEAALELRSVTKAEMMAEAMEMPLFISIDNETEVARTTGLLGSVTESLSAFAKAALELLSKALGKGKE